MKRNEFFFQKDTSFNSVNLLNDKVQNYLKQEFSISDAWVVDYFKMHREESYNKPLDIVFFGDFLRKFLEASLWPFETYRIWTISHASKSVMTNLLKIPSECINVIPRYSLFKRGKNIAKFNLNEIEKFFFVGQIRCEKNILLVLWLTYYLQKIHKKNIELNLVGTFSDDNFKAKILNFINEQDWTIRPIIHGFIENFNFNPKDDRSALINLSTYFYEDFDLAQALAQEAGWSSILSAWGGHLDVEGESHLKIPYQLIGECGDNHTESKIRAKVLANYLVNQCSNNFTITAQPPTTLPTSLSITELHNLHSNLLKKWGPSLYYILRLNLALARDSQKGFAFVNEYFHFFSGNNFNYKNAILLDSNNELSNAVNRLSTYQIDEHTIFLQSNNLVKKCIIDELTQLEYILIPTELENFPSIQFIFEILGDRCLKF